MKDCVENEEERNDFKERSYQWEDGDEKNGRKKGEGRGKA